MLLSIQSKKKVKLTSDSCPVSWAESLYSMAQTQDAFASWGRVTSWREWGKYLGVWISTAMQGSNFE